MEDRERYETYDNEITLKELILKIQEYWGVLWNKKWLIIGAGLMCGLLFATRTYLQEDVYVAELTYMVNEDSGGGGLGGASAILGQFGFGGSSSEYNLDKIVALAKSQKIIGQALLDTAYKPLLANQLIEAYQLHERWEESELISGFTFGRGGDPLAHNKALKSLVSLVRGSEKTEGIANFGYAEETGILSINVSSLRPELSIVLTESIYDKLSNFYINEATERPKKNYLLLAQRADSIARELAITEQNIARYQDASQGLLLRNDQVAQNKLQRSAQILTLMYGEVVKNKETADFILKSETPFFQVVDRSQQPISSVPKGVNKQLVIGGIAGGLVCVIFLIGGYIYHQAMEE